MYMWISALNLPTLAALAMHLTGVKTTISLDDNTDSEDPSSNLSESGDDNAFSDTVLLVFSST